jgi:uncharacterized iron-regulated membrane protein
MAGSINIRRWYLLHKWSSLICTVFLLVLCLTGLPLVFGEEISAWSSDEPPHAVVPEGTPMANLDAMVTAASGPAGLFPGEIVRWVSIEDDRPEVWIALAPSYLADRKLNHVVKFDAYTGQLLQAGPSAAMAKPTLMGVIFRLHKDLLLGLVGELFLAVIGLLFVLAIVSGIVLYGPFMRKLSFGTIRRDRGARIKWLDMHNLLGIVTCAWVLLVGVTGVMNAVSEPLYGYWRESALGAMLRPYEGKPMPTELSSLQAAFDMASASLPGMKIRSLRYPDGELGSPHHYLIWAIGDSLLTSRLFQPVLVEARTGALVKVGQPPWYLTALQLSRPLHFGDYGGLPLKIIWALLDLLTIAVLGSGIYLWLARRKAGDLRMEKLAAAHAKAI